MQTIRSLRGPSNPDRHKGEAGKHPFSQHGSCRGCHGGEKWTLSTRFYEPTVVCVAGELERTARHDVT